jgi:hypothetical protein
MTPRRKGAPLPQEYIGVRTPLSGPDRHDSVGEDRDRRARRERPSALSERMAMSEPTMQLSKGSRRAEQVMRLNELVERLRGMFLEVPGTRLSVHQAARLAGVEPSICRHVLETLTASHFLKLGHDGTFMLR